MSLNIVSNYSANVAHRNLASTEMQMSSSLAKLSAGSRVLSAKDDAASLAIGSRIAAEVSALKQANVNAGQASSMLQIADGAMGTTQDILTRMKTLAVQGASDNLSSTERSMIDTEYQALLGEIDRVANDTEFNGTKLVQGSTQVTAATNSVADGTANANKVQAADGISSIEFDDDVASSAFTVDFDASSNVLTVTNLTDGTSEGINIGGTAINQNETQEVRFDTVGATLTLNDAFDKTADIDTSAGTGHAVTGISGSITASTGTPDVDLSISTNAEELNLGGITIAFSGASADNMTLTSSNGFSVTGIDVTAGGSATLTNGSSTFAVTITVNTAFSDGDTATVSFGGGDISTSSFEITAATSSGAQGLTAASITVDATAANAAALTLGGYSGTVDLSSTGAKSVTMTDGTDTFTLEFSVDRAFSNGEAVVLDVDALGAMAFADSATTSSTNFTYKVGTGTESTEDDLTFTVDSITQNALGVNGTSLTGADTTNSDTALDAVNAAIDTLNTSRATIGAAQNRLGFASANLAATIENQEASRSTLMDLDVAAEMSNFTSKQVLMQAGVSMLAQANQVPQNLMRLFG